MAVAIVTPALGPSFGIAPAGTCTCRSWLLNHSADTSLPSSPVSVLLFTYDSAAAADSFITSPSWPVICSLPSPG